MTKILLLAAGGAVGTLLRYSLSGLTYRLFNGVFPWGTLFVNLAGSFAIGLLWGFFDIENLSSNIRNFIFIGILGGFTTFSTFALENFSMFRYGQVKLLYLQDFCSQNILLTPSDKEKTMKLPEEGKLLRIFIGETDTFKGKTLYEAIVLEARKLNLAGATVFRGIMGYGATSRIHSLKLLRLSEDLPVMIEIVDTEENINKILPFLDENVKEGLITMEKVSIIKYRHGDH